MRLSGHVASMGGIRNMYKIFIQKANMNVTTGRQMAQMEKER
jgi:hypothetical protein